MLRARLRTGYTFDGNVLPTDNSTYRFSFDVNSDPDGKFLIQGRRAAGGGTFNVFLNALRVAKRHLRVSKIEFVTPFDITLTIEVLNPAAVHHVEQKTALNDAEWAEVPNVLYEGPTGNILKASFEVPPTDTRFYRIVQEP